MTFSTYCTFTSLDDGPQQRLLLLIASLSQRCKWTIEPVSPFLTLLPKVFTREVLERLWRKVLAQWDPPTLGRRAGHVLHDCCEELEDDFEGLRSQRLSVLSSYFELRESAVVAQHSKLSHRSTHCHAISRVRTLFPSVYSSDNPDRL